MALLFTEGFDSYPNPIPLWYKWNRQTTAPRVTGRTGFGIQVNSGDFIARTVEDTTTMIVGFAIKPTNTGAANYKIARIYNKEDQAVINVGLTGFTTIYVEDFNAVVDISTFNLPLNQWSYIEIKVSQAIDNAPVGAVRVRATVGALIHTLYTSPGGRDFNNATLNTVCTCVFNGDGDQQYDDIYIADTTGPANNDFLGAIKIKTLMPTANGFVTQLNPVGAGTNYQAVNNPVLTPDTTYVDSRIIGDKDLYVGGGLVVTPGNSVAAVVVNAVTRKDKSGYGNIGLPVRFGSTDSDSCAYFVPSGYQTFQRHLDLNPVTNAPWNQLDVNSMQAGVSIGGCPEPPEDVMVIRGFGQITIAWNPPSTGPTPDCYTIYRSDTVGGVGTPIATCIQGTTYLETVTGRSYIDTTVVNGTTYYYYVVSVLGDCCVSNTGGPGTSPSTSWTIIPGAMQVLKLALVDQQIYSTFNADGFYLTRTCYYPIQTQIFGTWINEGDGLAQQHFDIALNYVQETSAGSNPPMRGVDILNQLAIPYNYTTNRGFTRRYDFDGTASYDSLNYGNIGIDSAKKPATGQGGTIYVLNETLGQIHIAEINALTGTMSLVRNIDTTVNNLNTKQMALAAPAGYIYFIDNDTIYRVDESTLLLVDQESVDPGKRLEAIVYDKESNVILTSEYLTGGSPTDIEIVRWDATTFTELSRQAYDAYSNDHKPGARGLAYWLNKVYLRLTDSLNNAADKIIQVDHNSLNVLQTLDCVYHPTYGGTFRSCSTYQEIHINPLNLGYVLGQRAEGQTFPNENTLMQFTL